VLAGSPWDLLIADLPLAPPMQFDNEDSPRQNLASPKVYGWAKRMPEVSKIVFHVDTRASQHAGALPF